VYVCMSVYNHVPPPTVPEVRGVDTVVAYANHGRVQVRFLARLSI